MKKLLLLLLPLSVAFADKKINLDSQRLICGTYTLTNKSVPFDIAKNCQLIEMKQKRHWFHRYLKIGFRADNVKDQVISCKFTNNIVDECKFD